MDERWRQRRDRSGAGKRALSPSSERPAQRTKAGAEAEVTEKNDDDVKDAPNKHSDKAAHLEEDDQGITQAEAGIMPSSSSADTRVDQANDMITATAPTNAQLQAQINQLRIDNQQRHSDYQGKFEMILNAILEEKRTMRQLRAILRGNRDKFHDLQGRYSELEKKHAPLEKDYAQSQEDVKWLMRNEAELKMTVEDLEIGNEVLRESDPEEIQYLERKIYGLQDALVDAELYADRQYWNDEEGEFDDGEDYGEEHDSEEEDYEEIDDEERACGMSSGM